MNQLYEKINDHDGNGIVVVNVHGTEGSGKSSFAQHLYSMCKNLYPDAGMNLSFTGVQSNDEVCMSSVIGCSSI